MTLPCGYTVTGPVLLLLLCFLLFLFIVLGAIPLDYRARAPLDISMAVPSSERTLPGEYCMFAFW